LFSFIDALERISYKKEDGHSNEKKLDLGHFYSTFMVWGIAMGLAILSFSIELILSYQKKVMESNGK
jgi:hypothetical protein